MRSDHFAFSFTPKRERRSAIPIACARAFTATTVRPSSSAMSKSEALEMTNSRSRSSSSEVQALQLFILLVVISSGHARFRALDATVEPLISRACEHEKEIRPTRRRPQLLGRRRAAFRFRDRCGVTCCRVAAPTSLSAGIRERGRFRESGIALPFTRRERELSVTDGCRGRGGDS